MDLAHGRLAASLGPWRPTSEEACPCPAHWSRPLTVPLALLGDGVVCPRNPGCPGAGPSYLCLVDVAGQSGDRDTGCLGVQIPGRPGDRL